MSLPGPELRLSKFEPPPSGQPPDPTISRWRLAQPSPGLCLQGLWRFPQPIFTLLRALGHRAFGEVYEGLVISLSGDPIPLQVAIKICQDSALNRTRTDWIPSCRRSSSGLRGSNSRDTEVLSSLWSPEHGVSLLVLGYLHHRLSRFSHQNTVHCMGLSLQATPHLILLKLMAGGDRKSFLRHSQPHLGQLSLLAIQDLLQLVQDIAQSCHFLEESHFIHRAGYYHKGYQVLLPVKWMPPEALLEGILTSYL